MSEQREDLVHLMCVLCSQYDTRLDRVVSNIWLIMSKNDGGNSFSNMHSAMAASPLISSIVVGSMDLAHTLLNTRLN